MRAFGSRNSFKSTDLQRAVRGAQAAGLVVERVEVDRDGKIIVVVAASEAVANDGGGPPGDRD